VALWLGVTSAGEDSQKPQNHELLLIKDCCGIHLSGVSRHLRQLRLAGLVHAEKNGREVRYRLQADDVIALLRDLADSLESCGTNCCVEEE